MLGIKYPIIGGVMGQVTTPEFVAAVSNAGGMGILASISYQTKEDFVRAIHRIRELTDKPFAVNLNFFPARFPINQQEYAEIMAAEGAKNCRDFWTCFTTTGIMQILQTERHDLDP